MEGVRDVRYGDTFGRIRILNVDLHVLFRRLPFEHNNMIQQQE